VNRCERAEGELLLRLDLLAGAEMYRRRGVHPDAGMPMFVVVGGKEPVAEDAGVFQRSESFRKIGYIEGYSAGVEV
jgi:hypothetical protein